MFFQERDLIRPVSMLGKGKCITKDYEIKIVNRNSEIAELEIANGKFFIEIAKSRNMNSK